MAEVGSFTVPVSIHTLGGEVHSLRVPHGITGKALKRLVGMVLEQDAQMVDLVLMSGIAGWTPTIFGTSKPLELVRSESHAHFQVVLRVYDSREGLCSDAALAAIALARSSVGMPVELLSLLDAAAEYLDLGTPEGAVSACRAISRVLGECIVEHIGAVRVADTRIRVVLVVRCLDSRASDKDAFEFNVLNAFGGSLSPQEKHEMHVSYDLVLALGTRTLWCGYAPHSRLGLGSGSSSAR